MTISNSQSYIIAEGDGLTTLFTYTFLIPTAVDVTVTVTDTTVSPNVLTVIPNTSYSITGLGTSAGGLVTYPLSGAALAVGWTLTIARTLPIVQDVSISNQGNFYPSVVEGALDYLTMICQDIEGQVGAIIDDVAELTREEISIVSSITNAVGTIALLKAATVTAPLVGTMIYVEGYYAANDGGGGLFYITNVNPGADNGGTIIHSNTAGFYYVRPSTGEVNVVQFGAKRDGVTDDRAAIISAITSGAKTIYFLPGTYIISQYIPIIQSNLILIGGPGVIIKNTHAIGFQQDGFRLGNPTAADGGTNVAGSQVYQLNLTVRGFQFQDCRIGVWAVYAKNVIVEDIKATNCSAAVGAGNDADDDCFNVTFRNITMLSFKGTAAQNFYVIGLFRTTGFVVDGAYAECDAALSGLAYLDIESSTLGSYANIHFDALNNVSDGITLNDSSYIQGVNASLYHCSNGHVTFYTGGINQYCDFSNHSILTATNGVVCYAAYNSFSNFTTKGCTTDLVLKTDATANTFNICRFNPGGTAVLVEQTPGGANGKNLQRWRFCTGIQEGKTDTFNGGAQPAFRAYRSTDQTQATGDGTATTCIFNIEEYDLAANFNNATGVFTAPVDGLYNFSAQINIIDFATSGFTSAQLVLKVGSTSYLIDSKAPTTANVLLGGSMTLKVSRSDTVQIQGQASGGTKTADFKGSQTETWFNGLLVA